MFSMSRYLRAVTEHVTVPLARIVPKFLSLDLLHAALNEKSTEVKVHSVSTLVDVIDIMQ